LARVQPPHFFLKNTNKKFYRAPFWHFIQMNFGERNKKGNASYKKKKKRKIEKKMKRNTRMRLAA
jgi:hypothetical protein